VIGKTIRLGPGTATVVGVLEPSLPYPAETQIIANVVTSPHHLGATMVTDRSHRMTELFGRLAPGATLEAARTELTALHAAIMHEHPEAYAKSAHVQLRVTTLGDQLASPARTILLVLLAAAAVVFVIACSNVANLILARSVRREGELALRAALGAGHGALRRTLLAESLVLCGAGAVLGLVLADPLVTAIARYASRFSIRAVDVPPSAPGVGGGSAMTFFQEAIRRIETLPGVQGVAAGMVVPWRDPSSNLKFRFAVEGYQPADGEDNPTGRFRVVSPRFFAVLGVPLLAGRDFTDADRGGSEPVAIASQSVAQR